MILKLTERVINLVGGAAGAVEGAMFVVADSGDEIRAFMVRHVRPHHEGDSADRSKAVKCFEEIVSQHLQKEEDLTVIIRGAESKGLHQYCLLLPCNWHSLTYAAIALIVWKENEAVARISLKKARQILDNCILQCVK